MKKCILLCCFFIAVISCSQSQTLNPDDTKAVFAALEKSRTVLLEDKTSAADQAVKISRMLKLGLWNEANVLIHSDQFKTIDHQLLYADYLVLINEFEQAGVIVNKVLKAQPKNEKAVLLKSFLEIQAWRLPSAADYALKALKNDPKSEPAELMLGRVRLLQKDYTQALSSVNKVISQNDQNAEAYLLEADVYFWDQQPERAEKPLIKSLTLDPYNADARFSYGYAIWRRVDATQLNAMAAQWELALAINPYHYQTHWHWGNGHTNLTYADYAEKNDEEVRLALAKADEWIKNDRVDSALSVTRNIERQYPASVLPLMHRASIYYSAFDLPRTVRLDSAEKLFKQILSRKKHYGPAHNGLSAVIKSRRIPYLAVYDSISNTFKNTKINDLENYRIVFPDVDYYAGETVRAMVWNQLYTSVVYFPFLSKQGNSFRIPPLHHDLAITMKSPSFRYMTTFDNRQWMDIRGVGSGAAAIEYAERGAFMERNVVLHEYAHLFHGSVLTDAENRQIRSLYYKAMKEKRTLDYYSQNNESEYFAQTYPAYFEPVKVHPLDFKSMNTTSDLKAKDPEMYDFIDKLVQKEKAYLAGDHQVMASNWAEVYVNLSGRYGNPIRSAAYLDTALRYDAKYLPAYLSMAQLKLNAKDFKSAEDWLDKAKVIDASYAPIYASYASLTAAKFAAKQIDQQTAVKLQAEYLQQSFKLETDYQELARVNGMLREMYRKNALFNEAIKAADNYVQTAATVSTYLRDRRDDALAFSAVLRSAIGDKASVKTLKDLVDQKPQNFEYRNFYADALAQNGDFTNAIATLKSAQRILAASGNSRNDYNLRIAEFYHELKNKDSASVYLNPFLSGKWQVRNADQLRYIRLLNETGYRDQASALLNKVSNTGDQIDRADYFYTAGKLKQAQQLGNVDPDGLSRNKLLNVPESILLYQQAVANNPYHLSAYRAMLSYYKSVKQDQKAAEAQAGIDRILKK
ncbi:tetratricopeptide repeat protein [Pedobacter metabolipauper]|uniref:Tetratricopeptide repeat protein n=1 Tax=Pedobacter metabolipauper TaxID=425513 RepID=A0A4R6SZ59_9SPHI|nr:tetratricopeptide repeat protein [Pedobacter metabolipauper]TDQ11342.1 tetratricopeptide repeat protein [Pedobacter metabolipauper]